MKNMKKKLINKLLVCLLLPLMIVSVMLGVIVYGKSAKAWNEYPYDPRVGNLFNYETLRYDEENLNKLAGLILAEEDDEKYSNVPNPNINTLISFIKDRGKTSGIPVTSKTLTVSYGKYNIKKTVQTSGKTIKDANDLVWMPVYMSTTESGDAVLTLYLAATGGPTSQGTQDTAYFTGLSAGRPTYTTDINHAVPSNMYGRSNLRLASLGSKGKSYYYPNNSSSSLYNDQDYAEYGSDLKYLDFLQYYDDDNRLIYGNLWEDIVTPSQLAWQRNENFYDAVIKKANQKNTAVNIDGNDVKATWGDYCWPNEAYGSHLNGNYSLPGFNYETSKEEYDVWQNDKVWLPSLSEVGTGTKGGSAVTDSTNGLWELTETQRRNAGGASGCDSWLRTANTAYTGEGGSSCTYSMFGCAEDGTIKTLLLSGKYAVRPAIHLNLSTALKKLSPPVELPNTVTTVYDGQVQEISDDVANAKEKFPWFCEKDASTGQRRMVVDFFYDQACSVGAGPVDAGEYYMRVRLDDKGLYFANELITTDTKVVKFVIKKKKLGIKWIYDGDPGVGRPVGVEYADESQIYDRDIKMGLEPVLGITYFKHGGNTGGGGSGFTDFDELVTGTYDAFARIIDEDIYNYNYELDGTLNDQLQSHSFEVGRKLIKRPYFYGHPGENTIAVPYAGDQYVQIANATKYFKIGVYDNLTGNILGSPVDPNLFENMGLTDNGQLISFKVWERGKYVFSIGFDNQTDFAWADSGYVFGESVDNQGNYGTYDAPMYLTLNITYANIEVELAGLSADCVPFQNFSLDIRGIYNYDPINNPVNMNVYYRRDGAGANIYPTLDPETRLYTLGDIAPGNYTMYVNMADANYSKHYAMVPATKTQDFKVISQTSSLTDDMIAWKYVHGGQEVGPIEYYKHDSAGNALVFDYDGDYFVFSLTLSEQTLHDTYYIKAVYSGDTFVKDAGLHCVTVKLSAFYKYVQYQEREFKIYFKINQIKLDISCLEWDYESPFEYDATIKYVRLTADSLALIPGLTAQYNTNGNGRDANDYVTEVSFVLTQSYAINYFLPTAGDESTYDGEFSFTCNWKINKAKLTVEWDKAEGDSNGVVVVPTLKNGKEFVDYIYEHKEADGSWTPTESLTAEGAAETYRVRAVLKPEYSDNYELENDEPCEFSVPSGKSAVSLHFAYNGEVVLNGAEFPYSGNPLTFTLEVDGGGLAENAYTYKYYSVSGSTRTELDGGPVEVGSYAAVVTSTSGSDTYLEKATEVIFYIVKADYDPSQIYWVYTHGDVRIAATYDNEQGKWVDDQGREVIFSFEYDGTDHELTVLCLQDFTGHEEDAISVSSISSNVARNANPVYYTAVVRFNYNPEHYNNPSNVFPELLSWQIRKARIDYNNVRWGYKNSVDGIERNFDFENNTFTYTRNENGAVSISVFMLGIPDVLTSVISYTTKDLSTGIAEKEGNTRAAIGEYLTKLKISGSWTNPNYEPFNEDDFPDNISTMLVWRIERRDLAKINYDPETDFNKFDNRAHNLLEICDIPEEQMNYFVLDITFVDSAGNNVDNNYGGYKDEPYMIFHAGIYYLRLYEIVVDSEGKDSLVIWDYKEIEIDKNTLTVRWNDSGSYLVAEVTGVYATDMVTTKYYKRYGSIGNYNYAEVTIEYIRTLGGNEKFYAEACATKEYEKDIDIVFEEGQSNFKEFSYKKFEPEGKPEYLEFPKFVPPFAYYTGNEINFEIENWALKYSQYLYISDSSGKDGKFKQTEVGKYHVIVRFLSQANACWETSNGLDTYNRDAYKMTFEIFPAKEWALNYPEISPDTRVDYTGNYIDFEITNWIALSKYITYNVTYKGESLGKTLSFRDGGIYTIEFSFIESSVKGYWKDDPDSLNTRKPYTVQIRIVGDPNEPLELLFPEFVSSSATFDGTPQQFRIKDWVTYFLQYADIISFDMPAGVKFSGGIFTATDIGSYDIIVKIREDSDYTFIGGEKTHKITFTITIPSGGSNVEFPLPLPEFDKTVQEYNGSELVFQIKEWEKIGYAPYIELSCDNLAVKIEGGTVRVTEAGYYTITISFKEGVKAYWQGTELSRDPKTITIYVTDENNPAPPEGTTGVGTPKMKEASKTYNGKEQTFELDGITDMDAVIITGSLTQKEVGEYTITIKLKDPTTTTWADGTTGEITLKFWITKATIPDGAFVGVGNNGKPQLQDADGNPFDSDLDISDLFDVEFTDKDGNPVNKDDLVAGQEYNAKLIPDEEKIRNSLENADDILNYVKEKNEAGGWPITYTPDDENDFNPLWVLLALAAVYAILLIIIVILARRRKRMAAEEEENEDYGDDDFDDDDYDDDDYDDDDDEY